MRRLPPRPTRLFSSSPLIWRSPRSLPTFACCQPPKRRLCSYKRRLCSASFSSSPAPPWKARPAGGSPACSRASCCAGAAQHTLRQWPRCTDAPQHAVRRTSTCTHYRRCCCRAAVAVSSGGASSSASQSQLATAPSTWPSVCDSRCTVQMGFVVHVRACMGRKSGMHGQVTVQVRSAFFSPPTSLCRLPVTALSPTLPTHTRALQFCCRL